jgi:hypothetical protein
MLDLTDTELLGLNITVTKFVDGLLHFVDHFGPRPARRRFLSHARGRADPPARLALGVRGLRLPSHPCRGP